MIAFVEGVVEEVQEGALIVRTGPFGVTVLVPGPAASRVRQGAVVRLRTHLVVREDAWSLYGFDHEDDLRLFRLLIGVSGIGPKLALAVLSSLPRQVIVTAVLNDDPALLSAAPGVGKRTAERIVLDLKSSMPTDLITAAGDAVPSAPSSGLGSEARDAVSALLALGYREANVKATIVELAQADPDASAEALIRGALARLR